MSFTSLKVFGERNTGTNFLQSFLRLNTSLKVLKGGDGGRDDIKKQFKNFISKHDIKDPFAHKLVMESLLDQESTKRSQTNFGWKHAFVCPKMLSKVSGFDDVCFVFIIRNPWRFISSLHQKPYNLLPKPTADLSHFIRSPIYVNQRDRLSSRLINNPVELWNLKVRSYFEFSLAYPKQSLIVYYEDLVLSPDRFADHLRNYCAVKEKIIVPNDSSKKHRGDTKTFAEFCEEVRCYNPRKVLGESIFSLIAAQLDQDLIAQTPYQEYFDI